VGKTILGIYWCRDSQRQVRSLPGRGWLVKGPAHVSFLTGKVSRMAKVSQVYLLEELAQLVNAREFLEIDLLHRVRIEYSWMQNISGKLV